MTVSSNEKPSLEEANNSIINSRSIEPSQKISKTISWSKNGFIAYAAPELNSKYNLYLTYLENVDGKSWQLANNQGINVRPMAESNLAPELTLVSWSNLSTDLAVADIHGNFYILLAGVGLLDNKDINGSSSKINGLSGPNTGSSPSYELTSYNHMEMIYRDIIDPQLTGRMASMSQIVSFKWLNILKPQIINKPAVLKKADNSFQQSLSLPPFAYTYGVGQHNPHGACHPISTKQACVALRQNGECILYFQGEHKVEYHKISVKLLFLSNSVIITKSSIGFKNDKDLIVSAYDEVSNSIKTFLISIDWGFLVESAQKQKVDPHFHTPREAQKSPSLSLRTLHEMKPIAANISELNKETQIGDDIMDIDNDDDPKPKDIKLGHISSIDIISPSFDLNLKPDILISYKYENETSEMTTVIYRYILADSQDLVSEAFADLGMRKNVSASLSDEIKDYSLVLQDKMTRPGHIQRIETAVADSFIVLIYTHGGIDVIDRTSLQIVNDRSQTELNNTKDGDIPQTVSTMFDAGFNFPTIPVTDKNPILVVISPNLTSIAYTRINNKSQRLDLQVLEKNTDHGISPKELFITSAAFAFRHSYACYTNSCADDLLALIQSEIKRVSVLLNKNVSDKKHSIESILNKFIESIICESHKAINFQLDAFGKESVDKLLSNPPLQKLLSLQLVLGELQNHDHIISDIAWIVLNLRSTSFGIMFLLSSIYRQISKKKPADDSLQDSITRGECIMSLVGNVKWLIDLMVYFNQELLQLSYSKKDPSQSKLTMSNSTVLPIILSKVPRLFLIYALSSIGKTHEILKKLNEDLSESNKVFSPMKEALSRYFTVCNQSPLNLGLFENFLRECDTYITKEISQKVEGKEKGYGLKIEQKLVCQGELSEEILPVASALIQKYSAYVIRDMKVSEIYFYNVDWIDVGINKFNPNYGETKFPTDQRPVILKYPNTAKQVVPRLRFSHNECIDALRKVVISMESNEASRKTTNLPKLRKCTRCRSFSLVNDPLVFDSPTNIGLWTMVFQRTCICGNAWVNCDI
ncbi:uncharacterized protein AC631_03111 [Debaryomyces fabryi]|uniref:Mediator of RNA polymerase II transcription subunit 16 n=1 Tax=Debaryomyces fabryi TaxID=58627 RepID=A0A0V1PY82_9ASCO|nr:uncharacterized protein AC631_03111 [Debaryomyces fabryi]KSA01106.1 hypothetical protein AC631_03111 [Debaryomyces fabryi]CUM55517.1 unnamed protein product [Debaryomyces fabryi]